MVTLRSISARDFEAWRPSLKVIVHEHARRFASFGLRDGGEDFAMSWRSDTVEPVLTEDASQLWVGVDQRVACLNRQGSVMFAVGLGSSLLGIERLSTFVAVLCEGEVLAINFDHSVRGLYGLRDIPERIEILRGQVVVT